MAEVESQTHEWIKILLQHHQDTFSHTRIYVGMRDRSFFFVLIALAATVFESATPGGGGGLIAAMFARVIGPGVIVHADFLSCLLWFLLFAFVLRYYQLNVTVQRQYTFLHLLEGEMTTLYGRNYVFERESRSYLAQHPVFSTCVDYLYTWLFPLLLIAMVTHRGIEEWRAYDGGPCVAEVVATLIGTSIILITLVYLYSLKFRSSTYTSIPSQSETDKKAHTSSGFSQ